jgi:hypothetical protein
LCFAAHWLGFAFFLPYLVSSLLAAEWRPINPEDLSLKKSKIDPDADAEALFRDVRLLNEASTFGYPHNVIAEYIRLKIFIERGKDKYANVQIPCWGKSVISSVEGRTIEPNGTIVELKKAAIFEKTAEKKAGQRTKVISFAMPAVEPGSIIEYRWTNNVGEFIAAEYTWMSEATKGLESIVAVTFEPRGDQTEVTLRHSGVPDDESGRQHQEGWTWILSMLAERFVSQQAV